MTPASAAFPEVSGAILVGGRSRRFGRDKVLLRYEGKPLVVHVYDLLLSLFEQVSLVGHPRPELSDLGMPCIPDLIPGRGVLGGIYTALVSAASPHVFITGADMPFLTTELISRVLDQRHQADAVIPRGPRGLEPLCAVYARECVDTLRRNLERGRLRITEALEGLTVHTPAVETGEGMQDPFANINFPEDVKILEP